MSQSEHRGRLVVVDDEVELITALCDSLRDAGFDATGFASPEAGLEALRKGEFDVLLSDLMMPRMDGIQLLQAMAADPALAVIPLILLTAVPSAVPPAVAARVTVLRKPFGLDGLLEAMEKVLGAPEAPADEA